MAEEFSKAVEEGIRLSKRIYFGNDRAVSPPKPPTSMLKSNTAFLPTSPMVYAVIHDPAIVDNPDVPSYQPYVHGRCEPPALIPLHMINVVELKGDCYLNSAFLEVVGCWRLHCVSGSRACDCILAVPMGPQVRFYASFLNVNSFPNSHSLFLRKQNSYFGEYRFVKCIFICPYFYSFGKIKIYFYSNMLKFSFILRFFYNERLRFLCQNFN